MCSIGPDHIEILKDATIVNHGFNTTCCNKFYRSLIEKQVQVILVSENLYALAIGGAFPKVIDYCPWCAKEICFKYRVVERNDK